MTLKEALYAAENGLPIIHQTPVQDPIEYRRITQVGYSYNDKLERSVFLQLLDKGGRSVSYVDPEHCKVKVDG